MDAIGMVESLLSPTSTVDCCWQKDFSRRPVIVIIFHSSNYRLAALHAETDRDWIGYSFNLLSGAALAVLVPMVPSMPDKKAQHCRAVYEPSVTMM
jgi:hypothetical protein